jgi:hypothetical protein
MLREEAVSAVEEETCGATDAADAVLAEGAR